MRHILTLNLPQEIKLYMSIVVLTSVPERSNGGCLSFLKGTPDRLLIRTICELKLISVKFCETDKFSGNGFH